MRIQTEKVANCMNYFTFILNEYVNYPKGTQFINLNNHRLMGITVSDPFHFAMHS